MDDDEMAWSALLATAAIQHGRFTRAQAAEMEVGRRALQREVAAGMVVKDLPGVLAVVGSRRTWRADLSAAALSTKAVASHCSAARLHRFDGFKEPRIEVTVARGKPFLRPGVLVHRWTDPEPTKDHTIVDGIACTNVATTLAQLGAVVSQDRVEQALDSALRQGASLRWIQETLERLHRPGPSGTSTLARLLKDERRSGRLPDSWFERLCQRVIDAAGIPRPVLQHRVALPSGGSARLDIAWPELSLGVECHSRRFHFGPIREAADHARDLELAATGWEVLYMTWHHKNHPDEFIPFLQATIETRSAERVAA